MRIKIIGAGLAGCEAAWQCARRGADVELYEMRPVKSTPAHQTGNFAELVCSNSLKSESANTAPWLLKEEMRRTGSLLLEIAREVQVPAGHALAVDREVFAAKVTQRISAEPRIKIVREEVTKIDEQLIRPKSISPRGTEKAARTTSIVRSRKKNTTVFWTPSSLHKQLTVTTGKSSTILKAACRSKKLPAADATPCASAQ